MSSEHARKPKRLFPLWEKQLEFKDAPERIKGFVSGQGAGKTVVGAWTLLEQSKAGRLYIVTASTYKMLRDATGRTFTDVARQTDRLVKPISGEDVSATIWAGDNQGTAEVIFRSTDDPDKLRGPSCSGVWMDEASYSPHEAYQILVARLREKGEFGFLIATFTPNGITHWTYDVFGKQRPGRHLTQAATEENPFINEELVTELKQTYVGVQAEQELAGMFVEVMGAEFDGRWFHEGIWFDAWPPCQLRVMSLDPSLGKTDKPGDLSAFILLGLTKDGNLWCDADMTRRKIPVIIDDGLRMVREFQPQAFAVETNQFQQLLASEFIRVAKARAMPPLPMWELNNTVPKVMRIRSLAPLIAQGRLRFKRGSKGAELLVQQLRDWPGTAYDDGPDALEGAVRMMMAMMGNEVQHGKPKAMEG